MGKGTTPCSKAKINLPLVLQDVQAQVESYEKSLLIYSYQKELLNQKLIP